MRPFDIYLAHFRWKTSDDRRPWLLVRPAGGGAWSCFPISTKDYDGTAFPVEADDADFPTTGLRATSYINDFRMIDVPASALVQRWGELSGDLLRRFRESSGV